MTEKFTPSVEGADKLEGLEAEFEDIYKKVQAIKNVVDYFDSPEARKSSPGDHERGNLHAPGDSRWMNQALAEGLPDLANTIENTSGFDKKNYPEIEEIMAAAYELKDRM